MSRCVWLVGMVLYQAMHDCAAVGGNVITYAIAKGPSGIYHWARFFLPKSFSVYNFRVRFLDIFRDCREKEVRVGLRCLGQQT